MLFIRLFVKHARLRRRVRRTQIVDGDGQRSDRHVLTKGIERVDRLHRLAHDRRRVVGVGDHSLLALAREVAVFDPDRYPSADKAVFAQPCRDHLGQRRDHALDLFARRDVARQRRTVAYALGVVRLVRQSDVVRTFSPCLGAQLVAVDAEHLMQYPHVGIRQIADRVYAHFCELRRSTPPDHQHLGRVQPPHLALEILGRDHRDRVRFLHVRTQLCEHLGERHADRHRDPDLALYALAQFLGDLLPAPKQFETVGDVEPTFVDAERLHPLRILSIDRKNAPAVLDIHVEVRRHADQLRTLLLCLPNGLPCLDAARLRRGIFCQNDAVPLLGIARYGNIFVLQSGIERALDRRIKIVGIAMQYRPHMYILYTVSLKIANICSCILSYC